MFWKSRKRVEATARAKAALGLSPEVIAQGEEAVGNALAVIDPVTAYEPGKPLTINAVPSNPIGHLRFAERMVAKTAADEARILEEIEAEKAGHAAIVQQESERHKSAISGLENDLADARSTGAFYATAGVHLGPKDHADGNPAVTPRRYRRRANKAQPAEVVANE